MTFAKNIAGLIDHVYGSIEISNDDIERLNEALVLKEGNELAQLKAIYGLFKSVTHKLLTELNGLEREHGVRLRIAPPTTLKLPNKVIMDSNDVEFLRDEIRLVGINNLKLQTLIDKMKNEV